MAPAHDGRSKRSQADRKQSGYAGAGSGESRGIGAEARQGQVVERLRDEIAMLEDQLIPDIIA